MELTADFDASWQARLASSSRRQICRAVVCFRKENTIKEKQSNQHISVILKTK